MNSLVTAFVRTFATSNLITRVVLVVGLVALIVSAPLVAYWLITHLVMALIALVTWIVRLVAPALILWAVIHAIASND